MQNGPNTKEAEFYKLVPITMLVEVPEVMDEATVVHALLDLIGNGEQAMKGDNPFFSVREERRPADANWVEPIDGKVLEVWDALAIRFKGIEI